MCLTCGCMDAHLEMGKANITYEDVKAAADENGRSGDETLDIIKRRVVDQTQVDDVYAQLRIDDRVQCAGDGLRIDGRSEQLGQAEGRIRHRISCHACRGLTPAGERSRFGDRMLALLWCLRCLPCCGSAKSQARSQAASFPPRCLISICPRARSTHDLALALPILTVAGIWLLRHDPHGQAVISAISAVLAGVALTPPIALRRRPEGPLGRPDGAVRHMRSRGRRAKVRPYKTQQ